MRKERHSTDLLHLKECVWGVTLNINIMLVCLQEQSNWHHLKVASWRAGKRVWYTNRFVNMSVHKQYLYAQQKPESLDVFLFSITPKTPASYIKINLGHKLCCALTLSGRVPNDIHHLG